MSRTVLFLSSFLVTLAACVWVTVAISRGPIERDLTERSLAELATIRGFLPEWCEVAFTGRDGQLRGEVRTQELKDEVERRLRGIYGVRIFESSLVVRPFDNPWIQLVRRVPEGGGGSVQVTGLLGDDSARRALLEGISKVAGGEVGIDLQVDVSERVEDAPWVDRAAVVVGALVTQSVGASAELRDGTFSIAGEMPDAAARDGFVTLVEEQFEGAGLDLDFDLGVAAPLVPAGFEMAPPEGGEILVGGRVADLATAELLLSTLRSGGDWIIRDQIVVAEDTLPAPWVDGLVMLLPSMLGEVVGGGVRIVGNQVELQGQLDSEGMFEAIGELAQQNFPAPEFAVRNSLRVVEPPREAIVSLITEPGGSYRLKGLLPGALEKDRIATAVRGAMPAGELSSDELLVEANVLDADWMEALVGLIPAYVKQVARGGLTINSNILAVEAVIESDADRDAIWAMTEHYFPDDLYRRILELHFPEEAIASEKGNPIDSK